MILRDEVLNYLVEELGNSKVKREAFKSTATMFSEELTVEQISNWYYRNRTMVDTMASQLKKAENTDIVIYDDTNVESEDRQVLSFAYMTCGFVIVAAIIATIIIALVNG